MWPGSVEIKKQVKAANDIIDVIASYIPVTVAGKIHKALCPFHNDTRPSLQIDKTFQNFRCWSCDAQGDVFDFVMRFEKVQFGEALRMLAERVGIALTHARPEDAARGRLLQAMKWAEEQYKSSLLTGPHAEAARTYLGTRRLNGATVRQFGLGFAPITGSWLVERAEEEGQDLAILQEVGLIATREGNQGYYDRFRDRIIFPIRDARGQTVGFGGRILPDSPYAARAPKYYNSADTPLFNKSSLLYGLDLARHAGTQAGAIAVVEGYTDVMMAHQCGVSHVVATMGTALTTTHVQQLRRYAPKVVLVYDADDGGMSGVDRALELFVSQDVELKIAILPEGLDPCDLLVRPGGVDQFRDHLNTAIDALEFKLNQLLAREEGSGVEGSRRVVDAILGVMALAPAIPNQAGQVRQELIVTRLSHRLGLRQETVWARLSELKARRRSQPSPATPASAPLRGAGPPPEIERQLLQLVLAQPGLIQEVREKIRLEELTHSGLRRLWEELINLQDAGQPVEIETLRLRLLDRPELLQAAEKLLFVGRQIKEPHEWIKQVISRFQDQRVQQERSTLKKQLMAGPANEDAALELLQRLQQQTS